MVWSPRELGELADTSRRTVRHYHDLGLLPEPDRRANGYGQYGVAHLVRLLRIRRLVGLGLSLPEVAAIGEADEHPADALRALDHRLASAVDELQQTRQELATILERASPTDLPVDATAQTASLPPTERAFLVVLSRVMEPAALSAYLELLPMYRESPAVEAFDTVPDDSDDQARASLAGSIAAHLESLAGDRPDLIERIKADPRGRSASGRRTIELAVTDLYTPVQRDVLARAAGMHGRRPRSVAS
ncbi:MerR family transcriptional regulator [Micromonospora ureilytica]|uniref:MerR family transcriptional regulator n=1 Tax=Micromonospora ureilytica TaxID=709868 RepID=UPI002E145F64|nr:MerR family transcriptional regulator [Micromonospora ureilytica]